MISVYLSITGDLQDSSRDEIDLEIFQAHLIELLLTDFYMLAILLSPCAVLTP